MVLRSGGNQTHADGFYYYRDQDLGARDPLASIKPPERRQQVGGSASGPIRSNKMFYFVNYDQQIRNFPLVIEDLTNALSSGRPTLPANPTAAQQAQYDADISAFNAGRAFVLSEFPGGATGNRHMLTVPSPPVDRAALPAGRSCTDTTVSAWAPRRSVSCPVAGFQKRMAPSSPPVAMLWALALRATAVRPFFEPVNWRSTVFLATSQLRRMPSAAVVKIFLPSALATARVTSDGCSSKSGEPAGRAQTLIVPSPEPVKYCVFCG